MALGDNLFNYGYSGNGLNGYENAIGLQNPLTAFGNNQGGPFPGASSFGGASSPNVTPTSGSAHGGASTFGFGNAVGGIIGIAESVNAGRNLRNLESQPTPNYSVSDELQKAYGQSQELAKGGYTGAEKASFQNDINRGSSSNYYRGEQQAGGNLGNAISRSGNASRLDAYDEFTAQDAQLHRQNILQSQQMAQAVQQQKNLIDQQKIQQRQQLEEQYGQALNSGLTNIGKSFNLGAIGGNLLNLAGGAALA